MPDLFMVRFCSRCYDFIVGQRSGLVGPLDALMVSFWTVLGFKGLITPFIG